MKKPRFLLLLLAALLTAAASIPAAYANGPETCDGGCDVVCANDGFSWGYCVYSGNPDDPGHCVCFI